MAEPWQNLVVRAGETKTITVPAGKLIDFLPPSGANYIVNGKIEYSGDNVMPFSGNAVVGPPSLLIGPVIITLTVTKPGSNPAVCFLVVTYRIKANV